VGNGGRSWRIGSSSCANDCESGIRRGRESKQAVYRLEPKRRCPVRDIEASEDGSKSVKALPALQGAEGQASGVTPTRRESGEQEAPRTTHVKRKPHA